MRILVTGALGNVGAEVVHALLADNQTVRAGDLDPAAVRVRFGPQVDAIPFDFQKPETVGPALDGVQALFLMRPPAISDVQTFLFPVIAAARQAGVRRIVFLSLIGIEKVPWVPHYKVEQAIRSSGIPYVFVRASFFMQNFNTTHRVEIAERDELFVPAGRSLTSFIDVRDVGAVAAQSLVAAGDASQAIELTGSEALDYVQVAETFSRVLGRTIHYRNPSILGFVRRKLAEGVPLPFTLVMTFLYWTTRRGMAERVTGEVRRILDREPIHLEQYVRDYRSAWMK